MPTTTTTEAEDDNRTATTAAIKRRSARRRGALQSSSSGNNDNASRRYISYLTLPGIVVAPLVAPTVPSPDRHTRICQNLITKQLQTKKAIAAPCFKVSVSGKNSKLESLPVVKSYESNCELESIKMDSIAAAGATSTGRPVIAVPAALGVVSLASLWERVDFDFLRYGDCAGGAGGSRGAGSVVVVNNNNAKTFTVSSSNLGTAMLYLTNKYADSCTGENAESDCALFKNSPSLMHRLERCNSLYEAREYILYSTARAARHMQQRRAILWK